MPSLLKIVELGNRSLLLCAKARFRALRAGDGRLMQQLMNSANCSSQERHFRSVAMSVSYANLHASIASINVSLSLFDVTDNAVTAELQAFAIRRGMLPDGHEDTSFGIGPRTFCSMDYIIAPYRLNLPTLVKHSKFNASGNASHGHTSASGAEFSRVDVLRERWRTLALSF
eukprot:scaffold10931_cov84-Skeletonema_dohrnii-CCMP3373.AAC.1